MVKIRALLNRVTGGRVGHYSTAEHYSSGPTAKVLDYYQWDRAATIVCPRCDWSGPGTRGSVNTFDELLDVRCPLCDQMLLVIGYPTLAQIEAAARTGHREAIEQLAEIASHSRGDSE